MNHKNIFRTCGAACVICALASGLHAATDTSRSSSLRFSESPTREQPSSTGDAFWRAEVDCGPSVPLSILVGARVALESDLDLDDVVDVVDTLGVAPADCDDAGRIALRRRLSPAPAVLRAALLTPSGEVAAAHHLLTAGAGSLLRVTRYCAAPKNGEPEWIEVRNVTARTLSLARVKLEGRAVTTANATAANAAAGVLEPGAAFVTGSDTAELRLWQPGARLVALSSWSNLRNSGDTIRLARDDGLMLDSVIYPSSVAPSEGCASLATEGAVAAAAGYALEFSTPRWVRAHSSSSPGSGGSAPFVITVRAPADGRYDLLAYDLDGRPLCALARAATGPATITMPSPRCSALDQQRSSGGSRTVLLHLAPRAAPGVRALLRITP